MEREDILKDVPNCTQRDLYDAISQKIVTIYELRENGLTESQLKEIWKLRNAKILLNIQSMTEVYLYDQIKIWGLELKEIEASGYLPLSRKKKIEELREIDDETTWKKAGKGDPEALQDYYLRFVKYGKGKYSDEAKELMTRNQNDKDRMEKELQKKKKMLDGIKEDPNKYEPDDVRGMADELKEILPDFVINKIDRACEVIKQERAKMNEQNESGESLYGAEPKCIPEGYTEVYFWGKPASGKTCALAAILRAAENRRMYRTVDKDNESAGYMTYLKNKFAGKDGVGVLPLPTKADITRYLPLVLKSKNEKKGHSISLIELSGELFNCFALEKNGRAKEIEDHKRVAFINLKKFLGDNRNDKIHFFFVEYGEDVEPDDRGFIPQDYFDAASSWFRKNKVFNNTTAIYLVLTKADKIGAENKEQLAEKTYKFFKEDESCGNFVESLKEICSSKKEGGYDINGGRLLAEPFSVGQVYLKYICKFDPTSANKIIDILLERVPQDKGESLVDFLNR